MSGKLVTVATFPFAPQAYFAKTLLDSADIECFVLDDNVNRMFGAVLTPAFGGVKLQVREEDAAEAEEILNTLEDELEDAPENEPQP